MQNNLRTILVIDDSPEDRIIMRRFLQADKKWSTKVLEAELGRQAIDTAQSEDIDCIIVDFQLPDMTGLDIIQSLCREDNYPRCPIVMVTGSGDVDTAVNALQRGAQDYLVKDRISPPELHRAVNNAIEKAALHRAVAEQQEALHKRNDELHQAVEARDVELEERRRVENLLAAQNRVLESLALGASLEETLNLLAHETEAAIPGAICSIAKQKGAMLYRVAAPSLPDEYARSVNSIPLDGDRLTNLRAIRDRAFVVTEDVALDPDWKQYHEITKRSGLRACWTAPVLSPSGEILGSFSLYFKQTRTPNLAELATVDLATRLTGIVMDRNQAAQDLRDSEEFNRLLLESSPDCVKVLDLEGKLLAMNGPGLGIMEVDDFAPLRGEKWEDLWPSEGRHFVKAAVETALSGNAGSFQGACPTAKGKLKWWNVIVTPVRDASQQMIGLLATSRDITTERQAAEEREQLLSREQEARGEAEAANRAKDEFIATLSHELRTPLAAITGWAALLKQGGLDNEMVERGYDVIQRNAQSQNQIIEDILDISRIITGKMQIESQPVHLEKVLEAARDAVQLAAENKNVALTLDMPRHISEEKTVRGDAARLQQVLWNLLTNAIKFTPSGGAVSAQLSFADKWAVIEVRDSGQGIEPEFLGLVFERFRQADGSTTRKHSGLGLGLAIVRYLVEAHGGNVTAQSDGLGQGATFRVELPLIANVVERENTVAPTHSQNLQGRDVIVVDDEDDVRELVGLILQRHGAQVRSASNAAEALALIENDSPDVLVTDIGMPEMDGVQLLQILRDRFNQKMPFRVVALTAYAGERNRQSMLKAGFDSFLEKPVALDELIGAVTP